jgi:hypothetical protein
MKHTCLKKTPKPSRSVCTSVTRSFLSIASLDSAHVQDVGAKRRSRRGLRSPHAPRHEPRDYRLVIGLAPPAMISMARLNGASLAPWPALPVNLPPSYPAPCASPAATRGLAMSRCDPTLIRVGAPARPRQVRGTASGSHDRGRLRLPARMRNHFSHANPRLVWKANIDMPTGVTWIVWAFKSHWKAAQVGAWAPTSIANE